MDELANHPANRPAKHSSESPTPVFQHDPQMTGVVEGVPAWVQPAATHLGEQRQCALPLAAPYIMSYYVMLCCIILYYNI